MTRPLSLRAAGAVAGLAAVAVLGAGCGDAGTNRSTGDTRTIQTAMGAVQVPVAPKRVVVLDTGELDAMLTLGITPVGAVLSDVSQGFPDYLPDQTAKIKVVGTIGSPDLEAINALQPDLILSNKSRDEQRYDELSKIAPTVFAEQVGGTWRDNFLLDADAVGQRDQGQRVLADIDKRAKALGARLGDPSKVKASVVRFTGTEVRAYCDSSFVGTILADVGFARPAAQGASACASSNGTWAPLSLEKLGDADGDYLFWSTYGPVDKSKEPQTTGSPLWKNLGAVRAGRAVRVDDDYWFVGLGPVAANHILDDLTDLLD